MTKLYSLIFLFILSVFETHATSAGCSNSKITKFTSHIFTSNTGTREAWNNTAYIQLESCTKGATSCLERDGLVRLTIPAENTQVFSMALAAYMAEKPVSVAFDDNELWSNNECTVTWFHLDGR